MDIIYYYCIIYGINGKVIEHRYPQKIDNVISHYGRLFDEVQEDHIIFYNVSEKVEKVEWLPIY